MSAYGIERCIGVALLLAVALWVCTVAWRCWRDERRARWLQDERDAEEFIAELREDGPLLAFPDDVVAVAMLDDWRVPVADWSGR